MSRVRAAASHVARKPTRTQPISGVQACVWHTCGPRNRWDPMRADLLIDQLADLAGQRNRDALDACFLDLFNDLLSPQSVAIYRQRGRNSWPHWSVHRRTDVPGDTSLIKNSPHPPLQALPLHLECWLSGQMRQDPDCANRFLVPMGCHEETHCLVEVVSHAPLCDDQLRQIQGVQRFYRHLRGLIDENERDALTRLLNRKSFDESFLRMTVMLRGASTESVLPEPVGGRRNAQPDGVSRCWLAVVDIDQFKRVNDNFGHLIGDEVLILVSQLLRENFRSEDRLYRFGGEEFVIMLRAPRKEDAALALERLRQRVQAFRFPRVGGLTVSIGFTEVLPSDTPSSAFERADQGVYFAKSNGRNQVADHESLLKTGEVAQARPASEMVLF